MIATRPVLVVIAGLVASCHAQKGCYIHPGGCDCTLREGACTGSSSMWTSSCAVCGQVDDAEMGTQGCYTGGGCNCDCWRSSAEADESVTTPTSADTAGAVASRAMGTQDLSSATCSFRAVISSCSSGSLVIALGSVNNTDNVTLLFM